MKKSIKIVMITIILSLGFLNFGILNRISYAEDGESKIDMLISNKQKQEELEEEINNINITLESKNSIHNSQDEYIAKDNKESKDEIEVISISFVPNKQLSVSDKLELEISNLETNMNKLRKELEEYVIEGVRLEKSIEEDKKIFLEENNLEFMSGGWPLESYRDISSPFGYRIHPISQDNNFHKGIDIPAPESTDIISSDDGIVIFSGVQNGYGNVVKIKHFDNKVTVYAHNTLNIAREGDIVKRGQIIAKVGTTGNSTGNHVHFETIVNDENINPIDVISN